MNTKKILRLLAVCLPLTLGLHDVGAATPGGDGDTPGGLNQGSLPMFSTSVYSHEFGDDDTPAEQVLRVTFPDLLDQIGKPNIGGYPYSEDTQLRNFQRDFRGDHAQILLGIGKDKDDQYGQLLRDLGAQAGDSLYVVRDMENIPEHFSGTGDILEIDGERLGKRVKNVMAEIMGCDLSSIQPEWHPFLLTENAEIAFANLGLSPAMDTPILVYGARPQFDSGSAHGDIEQPLLEKKPPNDLRAYGIGLPLTAGHTAEVDDPITFYEPGAEAPPATGGSEKPRSFWVAMIFGGLSAILLVINGVQLWFYANKGATNPVAIEPSTEAESTQEEVKVEAENVPTPTPSRTRRSRRPR